MNLKELLEGHGVAFGTEGRAVLEVPKWFHLNHFGTLHPGSQLVLAELAAIRAVGIPSVRFSAGEIHCFRPVQGDQPVVAIPEVDFSGDSRAVATVRLVQGSPHDQHGIVARAVITFAKKE